MATLLLEGEDLQALLLQARTEGGAAARIVRAERVRHGGVLGFFSKERFEVAVEIPDGDPPAAAPRALGGGVELRPSTRTASPPTPATPTTPTTRSARSARSAWSAPAAPSRFDQPLRRTMTASAEGDAAFDQLAQVLAGSAPPSAPPAQSPPAPPAPAAPAAPQAPPAVPAAEPGRLAAEGILGIADRVDAAERAALPAVKAPDRTADVRSAELVLSSGMLPGGRAPGIADGHPAGPARGPVPHEPPTEPGEPSTARPEFTALLDQLRSGTRPGGPARVITTTPTATATPDPAPPAAPAPTPRPGNALVSRAYLGRHDEDDVQEDAQDGPEPPSDRTATEGTATVGAAVGTTRPDDDDPAAPARPADDPRIRPVTGVRRGAVHGRVPVPALDRRGDVVLADTRGTLRDLGVPEAWTRRLRTGDRFTAVLAMLESVPVVDIDPDTRVVAVVGPAAAVRLEAHRTALDLAPGDEPRPVIVVPALVGAERATATGRAREVREAVVAVEASTPAEVPAAVETLQAVGAGAVIAVVDAGAPLEETRDWLDALGQVDAVAVVGATATGTPAAVLQLGLPVVRLDGVPVDRLTWAAVLCAQLVRAEVTAGLAAGATGIAAGGEVDR